jgi:16S rRNA (cytosine967-C5)-methyltransferase
MAVENPRFIVMEMLLTENAYSHVIVREVLNKYNYLSVQEKSFIKRLYEGTLERQLELDYVINSFSKVKTDKMKPVIRAIMRMGAYQILYMDAVPDSAACNEAVKLAQKKGFSTLKGFVNGVLRNIARNKDNITYDSLSVKYSMPQWIVDMWIKQLGEEKTNLLLNGLLEEHPVTIRLRDFGKDKALKTEIEKSLSSQGGRMERHKYLEYAYKLIKTDDITRLPGYENGGFVIQDVSSMLSIEALNIKELFGKSDRNNKITAVDICAAPGGKSMLIADIFEREGIENYEVLSRDISESKVYLMDENFGRCGLLKNRAQLWDALDIDENLVGKADIVIADVPCSGLGVIGKKRDIKYNVTAEGIDDIIGLQEEILKVAVSYLKPNGRLLFSTCTINQNENEKHFEWLKNEFGLKPVSLENTVLGSLDMENKDTLYKGYIQLIPGINDTDGFFISIFDK